MAPRLLCLNTERAQEKQVQVPSRSGGVEDRALNQAKARERSMQLRGCGASEEEVEPLANGLLRLRGRRSGRALRSSEGLKANGRKGGTPRLVKSCVKPFVVCRQPERGSYEGRHRGNGVGTFLKGGVRGSKARRRLWRGPGQTLPKARAPDERRALGARGANQRRRGRKLRLPGPWHTS